MNLPQLDQFDVEGPMALAGSYRSEKPPGYKGPMFDPQPTREQRLYSILEAFDRFWPRPLLFQGTSSVHSFLSVDLLEPMGPHDFLANTSCISHEGNLLSFIGISTHLLDALSSHLESLFNDRDILDLMRLTRTFDGDMTYRLTMRELSLRCAIEFIILHEMAHVLNQHREIERAVSLAPKAPLEHNEIRRELELLADEAAGGNMGTYFSQGSSVSLPQRKSDELKHPMHIVGCAIIGVFFAMALIKGTAPESEGYPPMDERVSSFWVYFDNRFTDRKADSHSTSTCFVMLDLTSKGLARYCRDYGLLGARQASEVLAWIHNDQVWQQLEGRFKSRMPVRRLAQDLSARYALVLGPKLMF